MTQEVDERMDQTDEQVAVLAGVDGGQDSSFDRSMEELQGLAQACGIRVASVLVQKRSRPSMKHYLGEGKIEEMRQEMERTGAGLAVFNDELSPSQIRNLEEALECTVMDRSFLILDIFASRARTREARLQVEIARLNYLMPRLVGRHSHLSRQVGGVGTVTRGGGETKLELDRRQIEERIHRLNRALTRLVRSRQVQRRDRSRQALPVVALVGYTNAGKSTLLNRLLEEGAGGNDTKAVETDDRLFATLQTAVRRTEFASGRPVLLTDTVGFVDRLPHHLVKAFRSTLEEVGEADLLLHVVDYSNPDVEKQIRVTEDTLARIGVENIPVVYVFNKMDLRPDEEPMIDGEYLFVSARSGEGIGALRELMEQKLYGEAVRCRMLIPFDRGDLVSRFQEEGVVLDMRYVAEGTELLMELSVSERDRFSEYLTDTGRGPSGE